MTFKYDPPLCVCPDPCRDKSTCPGWRSTSQEEQPSVSENDTRPHIIDGPSCWCDEYRTITDNLADLAAMVRS